MTAARPTQPLQGWDVLLRLTQGSSRTRNPGLDDGIPLGFKKQDDVGNERRPVCVRRTHFGSQVVATKFGRVHFPVR